jgi:hypothetical protein
VAGGDGGIGAGINGLLALHPGKYDYYYYYYYYYYALIIIIVIVTKKLFSIYKVLL